MKLKPFILLILIFVSLSQANSQLLPGDSKSNTVRPRNNHNGLAGKYYAGITFKGANSLDQWGLDVGVQAGGMVSDKFAFGAGFYSLLTQNIKILPNQPYFLRLTYGGIEQGFVFKFPYFAVNIKSFLGLGFAGYSQNVNFDVLSDLDGDWIMIAEPSVGLSIIPDESYWFTLDLGWRQTGGVDFKMIKQQDLNGAVISFTIKTFLN